MKTRTNQSGFALVASISLAALVILITLAIMSFSTRTVRTAAMNDAQSEAKANARMALMLAIGELQKHSGLDTRITANADLLVSGAPSLTGVWKSWEGTNHDSDGRPIQPDYGVKSLDSTDSDSRFLGFLVSGARGVTDPTSANLSDLVSTSASDDTIALLSIGSLGANPGQVHVDPQFYSDGSGSYAWWVSPENQKARLAQPHEIRADDAAGWVESRQSHSVANPEVFELAGLLSDPETFVPDPSAVKSASRAISLHTTSLLPEATAADPSENFHDLSATAVGLLTNTATGGWRKDLSLLTEKWDDIYASYPGGALPLFRYAPTAGATSAVPKPTTNSYDTASAAQTNLYPWARYSFIKDRFSTHSRARYNRAATYHAASASWAQLQSFATMYKKLSVDSDGNVKGPFMWGPIAGADNPTHFYNYKHTYRVHPQIARVQILTYVTANEDTRRLGRNPKRYELNFAYVPYFTVWNPYNFSFEHEISGTTFPPGVGGQNSGQHVNFFGFGFRRSLPGAMAVRVQSTNPADYQSIDDFTDNQFRLQTCGNFQFLDWNGNVGGSQNYDTGLAENAIFGSRWVDSRTWGCWFEEGTLSFKPGAAKIYSPDTGDDAGYGFGGTAFRIKEGHNPTVIQGRGFRTNSNLTGNRLVTFGYRTDRYTKPYRGLDPGIGFTVSFGQGGSHFGGTSQIPSGIGNEYYTLCILAHPDAAEEYWNAGERISVDYTVEELDGVWVPLFSTSLGPRLAIGTAPGSEQNRPTKGMIQNNALASLSIADPANGPDSVIDHPVNNNFEYASHGLSIGSSFTPGLTPSEGFIGTGTMRGDGLTRMVATEVPLRPMASLIELQGWNPRGHNPYPPHQMNLIGNSDANPIIEKNSVLPPTLNPASAETNLMHDDIYCANHLLFDDWFVSSIGPKVTLADDIQKDMKTYYKDFLLGNEKLSNRSYYPIVEDTGLADVDLDDHVDETIDNADSFLKVGSRFEVAGMFNINSTSVKAWRALLGHAKSREEMAFYGANGIESTTGTNPHVVSRGVVAGDYEAGSGNSVSSDAPDAEEFTGFRSLTDAQIDDLAEKIVEQVRLRGPFLSLSEFVNRQLSENEDLAIAGAVQSAINNLNTDPMAFLRNPANFLAEDTMDKTDPRIDSVKDVNFVFEKAAEGSSAFGAPGWIRQADILRPIAPVLSARDDTFTIRAYGDARDADGNILARAWCEATVQRSRNFVNGADAADVIDTPTAVDNQNFGRKYVIRRFRWLNKDEV